MKTASGANNFAAGPSAEAHEEMFVVQQCSETGA